MIYQHQYFQLDTEAKKVFDENEKELVLTGNAYRMLVFLCANKNATLTQIGDFLDYAKEYTENHLRQYRYKINTIISNNVVDYKNGVYSLIGDIKETDKITKNGRNTDLLQPNPLQSKQEFIDSAKTMKFTKIPAIIAIVFLLLSFLSWPYAYYTLLRIMVTGIAIYYAYYLYSLKRFDMWFWFLIGIIILFNPIAPIYIKDKFIWNILDIITAVLMAVLIAKENKN